MVTSSRLGNNIIANMSGRLIAIILAVIFIPVFISLLGIEAYGLIGFFISLQAALSLFELGLSQTCNRELARCSSQGKTAIQNMLDTLRSLEVVYWCVAILIGILLTVAVPFIASTWLDSKEYSSSSLENIVLIMVWVIAVRWPVGLYIGALSGLQQQVSLNAVLVAVAVLNWGGAALALWLFDSTVEVFFMWQLLVSIFSVVLYMTMAWFHMPGSLFHGCFSWRLIKSLLPFTVKVASNAVLGAILLQADRLVISAIMPLKVFAYYAIASMLAEAIIMLSIPISNAVTPRMAQLVGAGAGKRELLFFFRLTAQAVNVLAIPIGLMLAVFSYEVLYAYTGQMEVAENAAVVLSILAISKILHANMLIPYALQIATGRVELSVYINAVSVCFFLPVLVVLVQIFGLEGAAGAWLLVTLGYVFIGMPMILKQDFYGEWIRWFVTNLAVPFLTIVPLLLIIKALLWIDDFERWGIIILLVMIGVVITLMAMILLPEVRKKLKKTLANRGLGLP